MRILLHVTAQKMVVVTNPNVLVEGTQNFVAFEFVLDESWDGINPTVQFKQNENVYNVNLNEQKQAYLPPQIKAGTFTLTLGGVNDDVISSTNTLTFEVKKDVGIHQ